MIALIIYLIINFVIAYYIIEKSAENRIMHGTIKILILLLIGLPFFGYHFIKQLRK